MYTALTETDLKIIESLIESFQACLETVENSTVRIPNGELAELEAAFIQVFDRVRDVDPRKLTEYQVGLISDLNTLYVAMKLECSQMPHDFNAEVASAAIEWILDQSERHVFAVFPERLVPALISRSIMGGAFKTRSADAVLADLDRALEIYDMAQMSDLLLKASIYTYRSYALVDLGKLEEADAAERESLKLRYQHTTASRRDLPLPRKASN